MMKMKFPDPIFDLIGLPLLIAAFVVLFILETIYQLRKRVQSRLQRIIANFSLAIPSYIFLRLVFIPALVWLAIQNKEWQIGANYLYDLSRGIEFAIGFLLLDYTNYIWHILTHKIGFLWRFHHVHHTDLDLDVTTAVRFHIGELILSIIFRGAMVILTGATPLLVLIYEIAFEMATNFHHSNLKLPFIVERVLNKLIVTPRMHGIHHSIVERETDSNFSTIFSFWDRLHRTMRLNISQDAIIIGTPSYRDPRELTVWKLFLMPFTRIRDWQLPDGTYPGRSQQNDDDNNCLKQ